MAKLNPAVQAKKIKSAAAKEEKMNAKWEKDLKKAQAKKTPFELARDDYTHKMNLLGRGFTKSDVDAARKKAESLYTGKK